MEEAEKVERLAKGFAARVPELKFSPAEISSFLLKRRNSPGEAIDNLEKPISRPIDARPKITQDSKLDEELSATTEMVQRPFELAPPTTPPSTPNLSPLTLNDAQQLVKAIMDIQMSSSHTPKCTCSYTLPEDLLWGIVTTTERVQQ